MPTLEAERYAAWDAKTAQEDFEDAHPFCRRCESSCSEVTLEGICLDCDRELDQEAWEENCVCHASQQELMYA